MKTVRKLVTALSVILWITGCSTGMTTKPLPPEPTLNPTPNSEGGVCFDKHDAAALAVYVENLKHR